jgi:hypothetical protein
MIYVYSITNSSLKCIIHNCQIQTPFDSTQATVIQNVVPA